MVQNLPNHFPAAILILRPNQQPNNAFFSRNPNRRHSHAMQRVLDKLQPVRIRSCPNFHGDVRRIPIRRQRCNRHPFFGTEWECACAKRRLGHFGQLRHQFNTTLAATLRSFEIFHLAYRAEHIAASLLHRRHQIQ